jgi:signal transduction histidine kinase
MAQMAQISSEPRTVLLIEDNPGDARLIQEMLHDDGGAGFRLEYRERLTEGLERLAQGGVDLVLLDLSLPETQGLDSFLRVCTHAPGLPVVVLTGSNNEELGYRAVQSGAQDYLIKGQVNGLLLGRALRYAIERSRIEEELRQRAEQLAEMDRRKDEFLAMLAHELRNPLAAINTAVAVLTRSADSPSHTQWCMEVINRQMKNLSRLIDDLLDVSRITRGKIQLKKQNIDATAVVEHAVETVRPLIEEHKHELTVTFDPELRLEADPMRLEQIIVNLLTNAAKYTEKGGHISLTAIREENEMVISVKDDGVGILPEKLPLMFELFAQGERTLARTESGLGIGLTLARSLAELHGGTLDARSEGIGKGSEFVVRLPSAEMLAHDGSPLEAKPSRTTDRAARVLIVDDCTDTARAMARLLELLGHEVWTAHDGPAAIESARSQRPQFILLDIGLPGMDGYQVARHLRNEECSKGSLIIAVSGYGREEDQRRSREAGFDYHLVKPIDHNVLLKILRR